MVSRCASHDSATAFAMPRTRLDEALAFGDPDRSARVEDVERVRALDDEVVRRQDELVERALADRQEALALLLALIELREVRGGVGVLEVIGGPCAFAALHELGLADAGGPVHGPERLDVLQVHADALEAVGELAAHGLAVDPRPTCWK